MIRINLLPVRAAQKKERLVNQLAILILGVVATVIVCFLIWTSFSSRINTATAEVRAKQAKIASLQAKIQEVVDFEASKKDLQSKLNILEKLKADRSGPVRLLDELSKAIPEKIWILTYSEDDGVISMTGGGMTEASIASFLRNLEDSPYYMNIELEVIDQKKTDGNDYLSFKISCKAESQDRAASQKPK